MNDDIIEIIDDIDNNVSPQKNNTDNTVLNVEKKVQEVKYNAIEPEQETIEIIDDYEPSKNKSGLILVIVLFIILVLFIIFLPQINEIFGNLF